MAQRIVVPLFISSSRDCDEEKHAIRSAVQAYNRGHDLEVHAVDQHALYAGPAGAGGYAQQVANEQLEDCELYAGVWRERQGTPTPVAPSGTAEELENALKRFQKTRRPWVMTYFWKHRKTDFGAIFELLKQHQCFYHQYEDAADLERRFFGHLQGYLRDRYRLKGHSTTSFQGRAPSTVHLTFDVHSAGGVKRCTFARAWVAVGRKPERNEIVVESKDVHREQGLFLWQGGVLLYNDLGGDSRVERKKGDSAYGHEVIEIGDAVVLPDGTRIVLRAAVD